MASRYTDPLSQLYATPLGFPQMRLVRTTRRFRIATRVQDDMAPKVLPGWRHYRVELNVSDRAEPAPAALVLQRGLMPDPHMSAGSFPAYRMHEASLFLHSYIPTVGSRCRPHIQEYISRLLLSPVWHFERSQAFLRQKGLTAGWRSHKQRQILHLRRGKSSAILLTPLDRAPRGPERLHILHFETDESH